MKKVLLKIDLLLIASLMLFVVSCSKDDTSPEAKISSLSFKTPIVAEGLIDEDTKTITINVPYGTDLANVTVDYAATSGATITPSLSSIVDFSSGDVELTVKNGKTTVVYTVSIIVGENPLKLVLVGEASDTSGLDTEVKTAYRWALKKYGIKAKYYSFANLVNADLASTKVIWWHYTTFPKPDPWTLPNAAIVTAKEKINTFYKAGGNLLLTSLAGSYLVDLGRIDAANGPTNLDIPGDAYITNPDDWGISYVNIPGHTGDFPTGNETYGLFKNLTTKSVTFEGITYDAVMLSDGGAKKNRAYIWDFNKFHPELGDGATAPNARKNAWESDNNALVRSTFEWDPSLNGVELGAIVEFKPKGAYTGTSLVIGLGAYEWHMEDGRTSKWISNVQGITENAFTVLGVE